ncbi:hypothetical protein ACW9HR_09680 [Nocardia gipuzkoensis]
MSTIIDSSIRPARGRRAVTVAGAALVVASTMVPSACEDQDGTPVAISPHGT